MSTSSSSLAHFSRRALIVLGLVVGIGLVLLLSWQIMDVLLLTFAGVLIAVALAATSRWVANHTPLPYALSLAVVVLIILLGLGGLVWWMAPVLVTQAQQLSSSIDMSLSQMRELAAQQLPFSWDALVEQLPSVDSILSLGPNVLGRVSGAVSVLLNSLTNLLIILFIGIYLAISPRMYINGAVRLVPKAGRDRAREIFSALGYTLRWFLIARGASVVVVGVLSALGLWLLGIPLAFVLGVLTGLLSFVPIVGVIVSYVPPILVAFSVSPQHALYVFILYVGIQFVESYFLTPVIQKRAVDLPPVLTILAQVAFGLLFGLLGVLLASPIAAALLVAVQMLYVEDVLGDRDIDVRAEEQTEIDTPS